MFVVVGVAVVVSNVGVVGVRWYGVAIVCGVADVDGSVDCGIGAVGVYGIVYVHVANARVGVSIGGVAAYGVSDGDVLVLI